MSQKILSLYRKLTEEFINESIRDEDPSGLCFATSYPLLIYLACKQLKSELKTGKVPKLKGTQIVDIDHFWLQIDDEGTMLDPTVQQFNTEKVKEEDSIYIGKLKDSEVTKKNKLETANFEAWFPETYRNWKNPFDDTTYPINNEAVKKNIIYQIKLASILYDEMKHLSVRNKIIDKHFGLYFKPIYIFLKNWHSKKIKFDLAIEQLPPNFENLLFDVLEWAKKEESRAM